MCGMRGFELAIRLLTSPLLSHGTLRHPQDLYNYRYNKKIMKYVKYCFDGITLFFASKIL